MAEWTYSNKTHTKKRKRTRKIHEILWIYGATKFRVYCWCFWAECMRTPIKFPKELIWNLRFRSLPHQPICNMKTRVLIYIFFFDGMKNMSLLSRIRWIKSNTHQISFCSQMTHRTVGPPSIDWMQQKILASIHVAVITLGYVGVGCFDVEATEGKNLN